jgi:uncharacterized protein (DUF983 family)
MSEQQRKTCYKCNETKNEDLFRKGRNMCKECLRLYNKSVRENGSPNVVIESQRICKNREYCKIDISQPIENFKKEVSNYRQECKVCVNGRTRNSTKTYTEIYSQFVGISVNCLRCGISKLKNHENFSINRNSVRNVCRECNNAKNKESKLTK